MKKIFFYRNYQGFSGGHLKVWDYFNHVKYSTNYTPQIYFEKESKFDDNNPWIKNDIIQLHSWNPFDADVLFLAGFDWQNLPKNQSRKWEKPIINLIQGIRHSNPNTPLHDYLQNKAIRICVSQEVKDAIETTKHVNGPIITIPNGIDLLKFPSKLLSFEQREIDILILGIKNQEFSIDIKNYLENSNLNIKCILNPIPRVNFIEYLSKSKITIFCPKEKEGFYLPALEGMASGTIVICPDCIGNRSFCNNNINCIIPKYSIDDIIFKFKMVMDSKNDFIHKLIYEAKKTSIQHDLTVERNMFLNILNQIINLWN